MSNYDKKIPESIENNINLKLMSEKEIGKQYSVGGVIFELKSLSSQGVSSAWYDSGPTYTVYKMFYNNEYIGDFVMK